MSYWQAVVFPLVVVAAVFFTLGLMVGNHRGYVRAMRAAKAFGVADRLARVSAADRDSWAPGISPDRSLDRSSEP